MFTQSVKIIEFPKLYNILKEIEYLFKFNIVNYNNLNQFLIDTNVSSPYSLNSIIIVKKIDDKLYSHNQIDKSSIVVLAPLPLKIDKLTDMLNIQLIKQKYNFQSMLSIKNYTLDFNSRTISKLNNKLKLTEKEINIILFLKENIKPQSIELLQKQVWGYTFGLETHTVETHIYRLRKKIKDKFNDDNFIISHDNGYLI